MALALTLEFPAAFEKALKDEAFSGAWIEFQKIVAESLVKFARSAELKLDAIQSKLDRLIDVQLPNDLAKEFCDFYKKSSRQLEKVETGIASIIESLNDGRTLNESTNQFAKIAASNTDAIRETISRSEASQTATMLGLQSIETKLEKTEKERKAVGESLKEIQLQLSNAKLAPALESFPLNSAQLSLYQTRFEESRDQLKGGLVTKAIESHAKLIEDLDASGSSGVRELLFKCYLNYSSALLEADRTDEAQFALEKAQQIQPNDVRTTRHRVGLLAQLGQKDEALRLAQALRSIDIEDVDSLRSEAALLLEMGRLDEVEKILEGNYRNKSEILVIGAMAALKNGNSELARERARSACESDPSDASAWCALAFALGHPIIEKKNARRSISPNDSDSKLLVEGIAAAESAIERLKRRDNRSALHEAIGLALALYASMNDDEKAIDMGEQLWASGDRSEVNLLNLFSLLMRNSRFERAFEVATEMKRLGVGDNPDLRVAQSNLGRGEYQTIVDKWNQINSQVTDAVHREGWIELVARAYCGIHEPDRALELLDCERAAQRNPSISQYVTYARVYSEQERAQDAIAAFEAAEQLDLSSVKVAVEYGLYLKRTEKWSEAIVRLERAGAVELLNPFHKDLISCYYNAGEYDRCSRLIHKWMDGNKGYDETIYMVGARISFRAGDMERAKSLLETLLHNGHDRENAHRKMLGQVYLHLDDLEKSYTLLAKVSSERREDTQLFVMLGQVSTARRRYIEALKFLSRALELAPEDEYVRCAFLTGMLAVPDGIEIPSDLIATGQHNLEVLAASSSPHVQTFKVRRGDQPDFSEIKRVLDDRKNVVKDVLAITAKAGMPVGFLAKQAGLDYMEAWEACVCDANQGILMCDGSYEEQYEEVKSIRSAEKIVVDLLFLVGLQKLGILRHLENCAFTVVAHISLLESVVLQLRHLKDYVTGERLVTNGERLHIIDVDTAVIRERIECLTEIRNFLKSAGLKLVGLYSPVPGDAEDLIRTCGVETILPILVAKEQGAILASDDLLVRRLAKERWNVSGFCTFSLLGVVAKEGKIGVNTRIDCIIKLLQLNYRLVPDEASILVRIFESTKSEPKQLAKQLMNRAVSGDWDAQACFRILAQFLCYLWSLSQNELRQHRDSWALAVWRAIIPCLVSQKQVKNLTGILAAYLLSRPAMFMGILDWANDNVIQDEKLRFMVVSAMLTVSESLCSIEVESEVRLPFVNVSSWAKQRQLVFLREKLRGR